MSADTSRPSLETVTHAEGRVIPFTPIQRIESRVQGPPPGKAVYYRMLNTDCPLIVKTLEANGFRQGSGSSSPWSIFWTSGHINPALVKGMKPHQKVNHFPATYEVTRKDRLYLNYLGE